MRTVLCYGDSNTWGYNPSTGERYPAELRWVGVLARALGSGWTVIPEGLNGRTTVLDDPIEEGRNGAAFIQACLRSHKPLDLVVIALGTNDLKCRFSFGAFDIAEGVGRLVDLARASGSGPGGGPPALLVLSPPPILELPPFEQAFAGGREKSLRLDSEFARMASARAVDLLLESEAACPSGIDGIHLPPEAHRALGESVARRIESLFPVAGDF